MEASEDKGEEVPFSETTQCKEPEDKRKQQEQESGPSCLSIKSNQSIQHFPDFNNDQPSDAEIFKQSPDDAGQPPHEFQTQLGSIFVELEKNIVAFVKDELKEIQKVLNSDYSDEEKDVSGNKDEKLRSGRRDAFLKITIDFLRMLNHDDLADLLQSKSFITCQQTLKSNMKKKFQSVFEGIAKSGNQNFLNQIFTELYITEGGSAEVNNEHEVRQIESVSWKPDKPEITIRHGDIFKPSPEREEPIKTVMTKGVAGIGKTVLTQKFILDWAEDQTNQNIQFMFPFTFRELNLLKDQQFSLVELVHQFFSETKGIFRFEDLEVVFIFDGLDECRLPLDFKKNEILTDITKSTSVDVILTNLIRGNLLPKALLWITTRPAAANRIPTEFIGMMTEIRGFTDPQKDEYFTKRFKYKKDARIVISHVKKSRSLHIMCHIPIFCWITATVVEDMLNKKDGEELPKTLTEMYIYFLVVQTKLKVIKYDGGTETDSIWSPENQKMIESLGKLAFEQLMKGNLIFYESDLTECGIDITASSI
ncbi:protein NLRC3-like [Poeciliopsis prolifica]|uniref:protein NLRC3-like n=1 Tax=Poeciliopsis prolifica TaxID=188132 RepID=UPI0024144088|nr:protein NLRC3-like [Poeciliopsis prolifica]